MNERHDIILRPMEGQNPPGLLQEIIEDLKKLVPTTGKAACKYVEAKGEEAAARVQEVKAQIYEKLGQLEIERERLLQERDTAWARVRAEMQRDKDSHEENAKRLELQLFRQRMHALRQVVDCIVKLRELGIRVDLRVVRKAEEAMMELLEE